MKHLQGFHYSRVSFISVVIKNELTMRKKTCPEHFLYYKCLNSAYEPDVLLTEHSLQLLFPSLRL